MSYLDFLNAAQAPEDAKEAARKLAEAKQVANPVIIGMDPGVPEGDWTAKVDLELIKRGPGRPKKHLSVINPAHPASDSEQVSRKLTFSTPSSEISGESVE